MPSSVEINYFMVILFYCYCSGGRLTNQGTNLGKVTHTVGFVGFFTPFLECSIVCAKAGERNVREDTAHRASTEEEVRLEGYDICVGPSLLIRLQGVADVVVS